MRKRILVIDDEVPLTNLVKLTLERTGSFEVRVENQGSRGYDAAKEFKPDLVLLDIVMPDVEGSEVARQIKDDVELKDTPIAFLTAAVMKEELVGDQGSHIGGFPFIAKPVEEGELIAFVNKMTS